MSRFRSDFLAAFLHIFKALLYSLSGLWAGLRLSLAFRQEVMVAVALILALLVLDKSAADWLLCLGVWTLVLAFELVNTALEEAFNLISRDYSPQIKAGKDMASAAVFCMLVLNAAIWIFVFGPDLTRCFSAL